MNPNAADDKPAEDSAPFPRREEEEAIEPEKPESRAPDPQEVRAVREILLSLSKVLKASRVYDPENPAYQKLLLRYANELTDFLKSREVLLWDVAQFHISYEGEVVYQNRDPAESLAFLLYRDGVRRLRFSRGLELSEIQEFSSLLKSTAFEPDPDDDLATLLWERDFANIEPVVVDPFAGGGAEAEGSELSLLSQRLMDHGRRGMVASGEVLSRSGASDGDAPPLHLPDSMPPVPATDVTLFSIGESEVEEIEREMAEESGKDLGREFISLLLEILSAKEDIAGSREVMAILERIAESYCLQGTFPKALEIVRDLRQLSELPSGLPDSRRDSIREAVERMGSSERLIRLTKVLDQADEKSLQAFKDYASLLGNQAIIPLCEMLGELAQMKSRRIICEAIAEMAQGHVEQLEQATKDPRWFVARNAAYILGMMKNPRGVKYLKGLVHYGEPRVRKEAIRSLGAIGNLESRDFLLACLQSSEEPLQVLAARTLANLREKKAVAVLLKILEEGQFLNRTRENKMEIFDALGRLGSDHLLPVLKSLLFKRGVFHRGKLEEMREGAAFALALVGTEAARRILEEGARADDRVIGQACRAALSKVRFSKASAGEESL